MRILRFINDRSAKELAVLTDDNQLYTLPQQHFMELVDQAEQSGMSPSEWIRTNLSTLRPIQANLQELRLTVPIDAPEVWAAGVTYERSREARNYEATAGRMDATTFYDKVYDAERPELFMKSTAARTVGPGEDVYLRSDSNWQIPEPELGLVLNRYGKIVGYTIGNDMSCRDIEGENPLYLPQAKMWKRSCSIGPMIRLAETVDNPYDMNITCEIYRGGEKLFEGHANTGQLKRKLDELVSFLCRDNEVFDGTVLLTGTCVVPPNDFTLLDSDLIRISISGIGELVNTAKSQA